MKKSEIGNLKRQIRIKRWFEKDILMSNDGVRFVVLSQHGKNNIGRILEFANKFGFVIKEL